MSFPAGEVTIPKPTRAALILSAKQWMMALTERVLETPLDKSGDQDMDFKYMLSCCERVELILKELAEMDK